MVAALDECLPVPRLFKDSISGLETKHQPTSSALAIFHNVTQPFPVGAICLDQRQLHLWPHDVDLGCTTQIIRTVTQPPGGQMHAAIAAAQQAFYIVAESMSKCMR